MTKDANVGGWRALNLRSKSAGFLPKKYYYAANSAQCVEACKMIRGLVRGSKKSVFGYDMEWHQKFFTTSAGKKSARREKIALMQFCKDEQVFVLHLSQFGMMPCLASILKDSNIVKVGRGVKNDVHYVEDDFFSGKTATMKGAVDLSDLASFGGMKAEGGLALMAQRHAGFTLPKPIKLRMTNWSKFPLTEDMLAYAAMDAFAGWAVATDMLSTIAKKGLSRQKALTDIMFTT